MFTGLIETTGTLLRLESRGKESRFTVRASFEEELETGESVTVDGACLTVVSSQNGQFTVDVSEETLQRTMLSRRRQGDEVNLERALRLGDRLGGHLVSGHVDGTGRVTGRAARGESLVLEFEVPAELSRYLIEKGSVAINGVSLTVNRCHTHRFDVNVVAYTARVTTLGSIRIGDEVNIEVDLIGKYVEKFVRNLQESRSSPSSGVDRDLLAKHGFL
ncbi:MAG: riboflavin synthase [Syntrophobacteria bacterium]